MACGRPLKSTILQYGAEPLRKEVLLQRNVPGMSCREEVEFGKPGPGGPVCRNQQDLLHVLPDLAQCLCEQAHGGNAYLRKARGKLCAKGALGQGEIQLVVGGLRGSRST